MGKPPIIHFDEKFAANAYAAHAALVKTEAANPELRQNEHWQALRDTAFARFYAAFRVR